MSKFRNIAKKALEAELKQVILSESRIVYDENHPERMNPNLEKQLRKREHSLGNHPIFPESDESHFEEKLLSKRFDEVLKNYKRHHEVDMINPNDVKVNTMKLANDIMKIESPNKDVLISLAVNMIREEFDITEDDVTIEAKLTTKISLGDIRNNPNPISISDMEFENHDSIASANKEVYKRRFINALIQGACKKCNHMFHLLDDELMSVDYRLPKLYSKLMSAADYSYLIFDDSEPKVAGGIVEVTLPKKDGDKPKIKAEAMTLPVLIHELVKGVMELLSVHGLPEDSKIREYTLGKADFLNAETWDMRLGPVLWERFTNLIDADNFHNKHHIFYELVKLPVDEFNKAMREIMAGTKEGKKLIDELSSRINDDFKDEEFNESLQHLIVDEGDDDSFNLDDIDDIEFDLDF